VAVPTEVQGSPAFPIAARGPDRLLNCAGGICELCSPGTEETEAVFPLAEGLADVLPERAVLH
jgi:hypothetical protein